jgi:hypothetical protein
MGVTFFAPASSTAEGLGAAAETGLYIVTAEKITIAISVKIGKSLFRFILFSFESDEHEPLRVSGP